VKKNKKWYEKLINIVLIVTSVLCCFVFAFKLSFAKIVVSGNSMRPNIVDGAEGFMIKTYKFTKINRFDVVACHDDDRDIIKRVVGLPNETISIDENVLFVNGVEVKQTFDFVKDLSGVALKNVILSDNEYLVIGDNRNNTMPARILNKEQIFAKNGFIYKTYDVGSKECAGYIDKTHCPILNKDWYLIKNGK
jgi:signal peptidase I